MFDPSKPDPDPDILIFKSGDPDPDSFLGIFRGLGSSEILDKNSEEHFVETSEDWTIGKSIEISRGSSPSVYSEELSDELLVLGVSSEIRFLGIPSEISEGFPRKNEFPRSYFRGLVSSVCRRNNVIPTTYRRFFPSVCRCFLVVRHPYIREPRVRIKIVKIMDPPDKDPDPDTLKLLGYPIRPRPSHRVRY
ncbi:hypothetical protein F2Q69_00020600 [Brassica cretica]|uniref:Uncharacterized protein n=1 Tax=Brassica cretica TaxID=69181 RepID=A0A8S9QBL7_BRACR|nr:hypothetical protein F2Q69_00020600 [Brassica cretica]